MNHQAPKTIYLADYKPSDFLIETIHLHVDLHEEYAEVRSILEVNRNPLSETKSAPLKLDGEELKLKRIYLEGELLSANEYEVDECSLTLKNVPDKFTLETVVLIEPQANKALMGLYKSRTNFCTQCEAEGFRRITYYIDRPDVMAHFTTTITADKSKYPYLLSNGNLIETKELAGNRHWVHWEDPSLKPCYLFALVAGDFDVLTDTYTTLSGHQVDLQLYLEKGFKDQGEYALEALKKAMKWDEETYQREYELSVYMIVAVSDFNMGAMENKGLNIFNTKYILAKPETATDSDYVGIEKVIGHEYFHNWTGNRITCRDWFQLTLKEGLTVFRDETFTEDMTHAGAARIDTVNAMRNGQFPEDAGPLAHPIRPQSYMEINNFYTNTVYTKGAEVIRMIRTLIGRDNFHKSMDIYFEKHDGQAVTTEDFVAAMEAGSGRDLTQFKRWYDQAGTPLLEVESDYNFSAKTYTLKFKQSCPATPGQTEKLPFHLPIAVGLIGREGQALSTQLADEESTTLEGTRVLELTEAEQTFTFINVDQEPIPSLLRDFSAPVKLKYDYSDEELLLLLKSDTDLFSRYEAGQRYLKRQILELTDYHQQGKTLQVSAQLLRAFQTMLEDQNEDPFALTYLLALPQFPYLLQDKTDLDIQALHAARECIKSTIAIELKEVWRACYDRLNLEGAYSFAIEDVSKRALRNLALFYLTATKDSENFELALNQFKQSDNMTDVMAALNALNHHECPQREMALEAFYKKWKNQPLVVNKWLTLQATSLLPNTLGAVKKLTKHPAYDTLNPNNVYSLVVAFAANTVRFHESSGEGYRFLADQVLLLDGENPQVAARVLTPLTRWAQYNVQLQGLMKKELLRILNTPKLSPDVYELTNKSVH